MPDFFFTTRCFFFPSRRNVELYRASCLTASDTGDAGGADILNARFVKNGFMVRGRVLINHDRICDNLLLATCENLFEKVQKLEICVCQTHKDREKGFYACRHCADIEKPYLFDLVQTSCLSN